MADNIQHWTEPRWVALYTNPRAEKKVAEAFSKMGIENYLPLQRRLHKWSDRSKWVEVPLFPSYIFAKIVSNQVVATRNVNGVVCMVTFGPTRTIAFTPDKEIETLRIILKEEMDLVVHDLAQLRKGVKARVLDGPLKGKEGIIVGDVKNGEFVVKVEALSAAVSVNVPVDMLQFVEEEDSKPKGIWNKK